MSPGPTFGWKQELVRGNGCSDAPLHLHVGVVWVKPLETKYILGRTIFEANWRWIEPCEAYAECTSALRGMNTFIAFGFFQYLVLRTAWS